MWKCAAIICARYVEFCWRAARLLYHRVLEMMGGLVDKIRNKKCGFCQPDLPSFQELCDTADEQLFDKIQHNKHHLLHYLLPAPSAASQCHNLRRRPHTQLLPQHRGHLTDSNFMTRILYKNIYWRYHETIHTYNEPRTNCHHTSSFIIVNHLAFCQTWSVNEYVMLCYVMCSTGWITATGCGIWERRNTLCGLRVLSRWWPSDTQVILRGLRHHLLFCS